MEKRYIVTNPKEVIKFGKNELIKRIVAGKYEVEHDIACFIYYPCEAVVNGGATYADVTAAFNYRGIHTKDGLMTITPERLMRYFILENEDEETRYIRFNTEYKDEITRFEEMKVDRVIIVFP